MPIVKVKTYHVQLPDTDLGWVPYSFFLMPPPTLKSIHTLLWMCTCSWFQFAIQSPLRRQALITILSGLCWFSGSNPCSRCLLSTYLLWQPSDKQSTPQRGLPQADSSCWAVTKQAFHSLCQAQAGPVSLPWGAAFLEDGSRPVLCTLGQAIRTWPVRTHTCPLTSAPA